jgi:hypothetical protein
MIISQGQQNLWQGIRSDFHSCHGLNVESEQQEEHRFGEEGLEMIRRFSNFVAPILPVPPKHPQYPEE